MFLTGKLVWPKILGILCSAAVLPSLHCNDSRARSADTSVYTPALCILAADQAFELSAMAKAANELNFKVNVSLPPECHFPPAEALLKDPDKYLSDTRAIGRKLKESIKALEFEKNLPESVDIVTSNDCALELPPSGSVQFKQSDFWMKLGTETSRLRGAIVQNHMVFFAKRKGSDNPLEPIYGDWTGSSAFLFNNDLTCRIEIYASEAQEGSAVAFDRSKRLMHLTGSTDRATVAIPQGFQIGSASFSDRHSIWEFVPTGETVYTWTKIFTVSGSATDRPFSFEQVKKFQKTAEAEFYRGCKKKTKLKADPKFSRDKGVAVAEWAVSCDLIKSGPSAGKPETNVFRYIQGKELGVTVSIGFRYAPSPAEIEEWKRRLRESSVKLR